MKSRFSQLLFLTVVAVAFCAWASPSAFAEIEPCPLLLKGVPIASPALAALQSSEKHFKIETLTQEINGKKRLVILAGETHAKDQAASESGKRLLAEFSLRGFEAPDDQNSLAAKIFYPFKRAMNFTTNQILKKRESTINDALTINNQKENVINLWLEKGHVPDFAEKSSLLQLPIVIGVSTTDFSLWYANHQEMVLPSGVLEVAAVSTSALSAYLILQSLLHRPFSEKNWYRKVFPASDGHLFARNLTMTKNMIKGLEEHPEEDQMLVLVGSAHVPGMKKILMEQYGFSE